MGKKYFKNNFIEPIHEEGEHNENNQNDPILQNHQEIGEDTYNTEIYSHGSQRETTLKLE